MSPTARASVDREISRCSSIRRENSSSSIARPRSTASSRVSSTGKPYVAASVNASSPLIAPRAATSSNTLSPRSSVWEKRSSSALTVSLIKARFSTSSGYQVPICSTTMSVIRQRSDRPIVRACWTARLMMRRRT